MTLWRMDVSCPCCGSGEFERVNGSPGLDLLAVSVLACCKCGREWEVSARIIPRPRPEAERQARHRKAVAA